MALRRSGRRLALLLFSATGLLVILSALPAPARSSERAATAATLAKIQPWVIAHTTDGQQAEFLVVLTDQADLSGAARFTAKREKGRYVYQTLFQKAHATQGPIVQWLSDRGVAYRAYYIVNLIWVEADRDIALALAARSDVARLEGNPEVHLSPEQPIGLQQPVGFGTIEPGIQYIHAPQVWALGYTGQGIVVGGQDTGYQWDHPALKNQYRGWNGASVNHDYNWHDSIITNTHGYNQCGFSSPVPCDDYGHGTHTMGTAVGSDGGANQIGVAPGAKWIGCRNMDNGYGSPSTYLECFEFFLAPYPVGGTPAQGDPSLAPDVTTNSWSCPDYEGCNTPDVLKSAVEAQQAAGIMTVVAATNDGPGCSTIVEPPSLYAAAYTVGALNTGTDSIAGFSSRGPVTVDGSNRRKPDIAAPGTSTRSSIPGDSYGYLSGTSMATPHVAGAVALLWSAYPQLTNQISATEQILNDFAAHLPTVDCSSNGWPNNLSGYGRLDVLAAVDRVPPAVVAGVVHDAATSAGLSQAFVRAAGITSTFFTTTGFNGSYTLNVLSGTYTITVSAENYNTVTVAGVEVSPAVTAIQNFTLTFQPRHDVILAPSLLSESGIIGHAVTYTLHFTNTGNVTDAFQVGFDGNAWPTSASPLSATLGVQASSPLVVTVTIPLTATHGLTDDIRVSLTGTNVAASAQLDITADLPYDFYLVLIRKD